MMLITTGVLLFFSLIAVSLRLYCRAILVRCVGLDDYFMLVALIVAIGLGIMNGFQVSYGTGRQSKDLNFDHFLIPTLKHWYAYQLVYPWALFCVKASILALYHRIFTHHSFRRWIYYAAGFIIIQTITVTFINAFECGTKPSRAWSAKFPEGCNDMPRTYFAMASVNIITDIVILIMPFKVFKQLNMHPRKRFALMGIFMVGGIAVIASIMRLYALYVFAVSKDIPYDDIFILLLSQIEVNVAMISASAPAYRPLFNKVFSSSSSSPYVRPASDYPTVGSGRPAYNRRRKASRDQMELFSVLSTGKRASKTHARNTSEESILGEEGIRKTIDVRVIEEEEKERQNGEDRNDPAYWRGA
ncbi:uncharacterized protein J4E78_006495 [Alternaria triticimaculans]|uniref:uncharacterized protein n=1 Tax=Alternaria triticimaculans TaxID=297637 RepID=UPI0020C57994|nr:uncharacterized protein J4E78_006495 [Alternaria triticimaculans]KAI4656606.1 hypothetical protein J4E78_006495 [Alternaria triticimaculans]